MNLLIVSQYFWPENFRINDVARGLSNLGHKVTVLTGMPNYPGGALFKGYSFAGPYTESWDTVEVRRAPLVPRGNSNALRLAINYASHALTATLLARFLIPKSIDCILVFEPSPISIGIPARFIKWLTRAPIAFWVQDLWPQSLEATGAVKSRAVLGIADKLTRWIYRGCDRVLIQSEAFAEPIRRQGVPSHKIEYMPNSAESHYRRLPAQGSDRETDGLPLGFRVMFAGNIGAAQDMPSLVSAAELLRDHPNIHWIILGEGRMRSWVVEQIRQRRLERTVHWLGSKPPEAMPEYFAKADVLLATLRREPIFAYTIPSKIQSYLACGKPVIAALEGEGARIIRDAGAGWVVPPEDPKSLAHAVLAASRLSTKDFETMGSRAEEFFLKSFERNMLLSRLESVLTALAEMPR